jgi:HSP20 family protein
MHGVNPYQVEVTIANGVLTIRGEHEGEAETRDRNVYRREIRYGTIHRSVALPTDVEADRAEAWFENGILHLKLPKAESQKPRRVQLGQKREQPSTAELEQSQVIHEKEPEL